MFSHPYEVGFTGHYKVMRLLGFAYPRCVCLSANATDPFKIKIPHKNKIKNPASYGQLEKGSERRSEKVMTHQRESHPPGKGL